MKVLLLSSELVPERAGGIAAYTATIGPALAARGHEVHVLSCAPEHERRDEERDGVWWHRRRLIGGRRAPDHERYRQSLTRLATATSCRKELRKLDVRFDVIESPEWMAESLFVGLTTKTPVVVNLHTPLHVLFAFDVRRFGRDLRWADRMERSAVRRARVVTSASSLLVEELRKDHWLSGAAEIIPLPVDQHEWDAVEPVIDSPPSVLVVGRLEPRKAPEVAVEASALLAKEIEGLEVTLVGRSRGFRNGTPYGEWVAKLAQERNAPVRIESQIPHSEMRERYSRARVVVVPSHFESFSIAALEGLASGRPVVYTSRIGVAEVLRGTGAGTEVPPNDPAALAAALRPYLTDASHAAEAGAQARKVARTHFSPDIIAEQRERCYEAAL